MTVTGEPAEITRFVNANIGKPIFWNPVSTPSGKTVYEHFAYKEDPTEYFCFNALIPCPEEVVARGYDTIRSGEPLDGYHWTMKNWGCKWDIWGFKLAREVIGYTGDGCTELNISFKTADTPPLGWLGAAIRSFPDLNIDFDCCCLESSYGQSVCSHDGVIRTRLWTKEEIWRYFGVKEEA